MRAVIYSRVSSEEQVQGYSLAKQQDECMAIIKKTGHEFIDLYEDDGYSAKDMNRPELKRMLADIEKKRFDVVVVWNTDRLSRDLIDGYTMIKRIFNKKGINFVSATEDIDTTTPDGMTMVGIRLIFAQRERERIGERVTMGQVKKAQMGRRVSLGPIYGYDKVQGKLEVNTAESSVIREIFEWYVYRGWGYGKISSHLNSEGVLAKKTKWWASTIKGILLNVTYTGNNVWTPKNGDPVISQGEHEPIVSDELFNLAQTQLKRRGNLEMSRSSYNYPFSSIVKCGECGGSYTAYYTKKPEDKQAYCNYRCANKKSGLCKAPDLAEFKLSKLFFDYFRNFSLQAHAFTPEPTKDALKSTEKEKARIEREIKKLENRKNNLLDDLGDKIISREDYKNKVEEINGALTTLQSGLLEVAPAAPQVKSTPNDVIQMIIELETDWEFMKDDARKFIVQMLFKRIVIKKEKDWQIKQVDPA